MPCGFLFPAHTVTQEIRLINLVMNRSKIKQTDMPGIHQK